MFSLTFEPSGAVVACASAVEVFEKLRERLIATGKVHVAALGRAGACLASYELFVGVAEDGAVLCAFSDEGWSWHAHDPAKDHYVYRRDEVLFYGEPSTIDGYYYVDLLHARRVLEAFFEDPEAALATTDWEIE
ncbi:MAG: hypothetical protein H6722_33520 [Sandaracinus sp.]|nr:hypothetical protein [Sandaracinus sp.]